MPAEGATHPAAVRQMVDAVEDKVKMLRNAHPATKASLYANLGICLTPQARSPHRDGGGKAMRLRAWRRGGQTRLLHVPSLRCAGPRSGGAGYSTNG